MRRHLPTIVGRPRCALSVMNEFAECKLEKRSINDLLQMAQFTPRERSMRLHETLKVGLARCAMRLSEMPFGFCNAPSIKRVTGAYVQNFQQVMEFEHDKGIEGVCSREYHDLTRGIFNQHRGTMLDVAKGVFEFYEDLNELFGKDIELAEVREELKLIRDVEHSLDEFFTNRLTLRLLISHVHNLSSGKPGDSLPQILLHRCILRARSLVRLRVVHRVVDGVAPGILHDITLPGLTRCQEEEDVRKVICQNLCQNALVIHAPSMKQSMLN
ncbi:unnamed protein product [Prorocentrum cordatum]|uniref:Protein-serine/threonine kinase n=1 Tax=Prorocentrum cordatum TaxID=2364126 RepID=A0ABN9RJR7_9DINO|nr:unnamed protein product [Polarella glacialis]